MKIGLIGYGKMGRTIEREAMMRGHSCPLIIDQHNPGDLNAEQLKKVDVCIEFTEPSSAFQNLEACILAGTPVVCGTTGWLERKPEIESLCRQKNGGFFYASNYSIGVNIFFALNKKLAEWMSDRPEYQVEMEEIHHIHKKDAPSGTAITLAEGILEHVTRKKQWVNEPSPKLEELVIRSLREGEVPGTHQVSYLSTVDAIEIKHTAHSRQGFARGAVMAAEWMHNRQGVFSMEDMLGF